MSALSLDAAKAETRADALHALHKAKGSLALELSRVQALDAFLREGFGIVPLPPGLDWWRSLEETCSPEVAAEYRKLWEKQARYFERGEQPPHALEQRFYDLIGQDPLFGLVHSQKRPFILDSAALLTRIVEVAKIEGAALDAGCNGGYHAIWLARETGIRRIVAVDSSRRSVEYARQATAGILSVSQERVDLVAGAFPRAVLDDGYELVYSIDGPIRLGDEKTMSAAAELLTDGGVLVVTQANVERWKHSLEQAREMGLSPVILDVVGGWTIHGFDARVASVFVKGATPREFASPKDDAESAWNNGFRDYANGPVSPDEKTQAYFRARVLEREESVG